MFNICSNSKQISCKRDHILQYHGVYLRILAILCHQAAVFNCLINFPFPAIYSSVIIRSSLMMNNYLWVINLRRVITKLFIVLQFPQRKNRLNDHGRVDIKTFLISNYVKTGRNKRILKPCHLDHEYLNKFFFKLRLCSD